jgi:hypothetical protein
MKLKQQNFSVTVFELSKIGATEAVDHVSLKCPHDR